MKVLYLAIDFHYKPGVMTSGITKKIFEQCKALATLGCETTLCLAASKYVFLYTFKPFSCYLERSIEISDVLFARNVVSEKIQLMFRLGGVFSDVISLKNPDFIYIRRLIPLSPFFINNIKESKGNAVVFWEIPTYPYKYERTKFFNLKNFANVVLEYRSIERLRRFVDMFVVVTEIENIKARNRLGDFIIIPNGFDVSSVVQREAPLVNDEIHILIVATLAFWHGCDRIISALACCQEKYKYHLHIVSPETQEQQKLKALAMKLKILNYVHFYGALEGSQMDFLFNKCHLAMGSLGRHRTALNWTSELKLREYAARGMPFACSSHDSDFLNFEYMLKLPADDEPVNMKSLEIFLKSIYTHDHPMQIRKYALEKIDWVNKMRTLLQSFVQLRSR